MHSRDTLRDGPSAAPAVVMPFHSRIAPFEQYVREGFWDGVMIQAVCDGAAEPVVQTLREMAVRRSSLHVHGYAPNRGVARARAEGIQAAPTELIAFCDDDDFIPHASRRLRGAADVFQRTSGPLFVTFPQVHAFDTSLHHRLQYDRRAFQGRSGFELLQWMVRTGELNLLLSGSTFQRSDLIELETDDYFKVSEDYVLLARLCARYPDRRVCVLEEGTYMRLIHADSLARQMSLEKILMNLISMCVGGYYLIRRGTLTTAGLAGLLRQRGQVLQSSYGMGAAAASEVADRLEAAPGTRSDEAVRTGALLDHLVDALPKEYRELTNRSSSDSSRPAQWAIHA